MTPSQQPKTQNPERLTFKQAQTRLLDLLEREPGWTVARGLKVPHATHESGPRLFFKSQSIYSVPRAPYRLGAAHSLHVDPRDLAALGRDAILRELAFRIDYPGSLTSNPDTDAIKRRLMRFNPRRPAQVRLGLERRLAEAKRLADHRGVPLHVGKAARRELWSRWGLPGPAPAEDLAWLGYTDALTAALQMRGPSTYYDDEGSVVAYWTFDPDEVADENPAGSYPKPKQILPVIKRGMVPQLILGQYGRTAVYMYRGWEIVVEPSTTRGLPWEVTAQQMLPGTPGLEHGLATTFDGAVCTGKILVDLELTRRRLPYDAETALIRVWQQVYLHAVNLAFAGYLPTRDIVASQMETEFRAIRRGQRQGIGREAVKWFDGLSLPIRVSLIDDRLELAICMYGTDPKHWP